MKSYRVGLQQIRVYETCEIRPRDAAAAVAGVSTICFVDRVTDGEGLLDQRAMSEAIDRHCRLKIAPQGHFELRLDAPPIRSAHLWRWSPAWPFLRHGAMTAHPSAAC